MKKLLAILLTAALLLLSVPAWAEGNTTDKPITFAEFNFGDTFNTIRNGQYLRNINFQRGLYSPRVLADAIPYVGDWCRVSDTLPACFTAEPDGGRAVAGHNCMVSLWFAYPVENGASVIDENAATFYAGEYNFFDDNGAATFDDLKQKLSQLYGAPYMQGNNLDAVLGELALPDEGMKNSYQEQNQRCQPNYVVWKSSANNAVLVLKSYTEDGSSEFTKLNYISLDAADIFAQIETSGGNSGGDSMEGL